MAVAGISVGIYFWLHKDHSQIKVSHSHSNIIGKNSNSKQTKTFANTGSKEIIPITTDEEESLISLKPFQNFNQEELYDMIKIKNGQPYFPDNFKALFIQKIINEMTVVPDENSNLEINVLKEETKEIVFECIWHSGESKYSKIFTFTLTVDK